MPPATVARDCLAQRLSRLAFQPPSLLTGVHACGDFVNLRCHDKIILVQTLDLLCLKHDGGETPTEVDRQRVMKLGLRKLADLAHEIQ